ncbi:MAG: pyruvate, phosphate dikinase [Actinomycetales bacterium]|nr:pyruvate, phosphate dikinase [Actinomycetales bacterium]
MDDVGLVPFGKGFARGLDQRSLCTRGVQLETLAGLGLPVGAGLTIPVPNVPGFTSADRAKAAMNLLESISGRQISSTTETGGLILLRLSASAPVDAAGLPPDLVCLGLKRSVIPDGLGEGALTSLATSWWKTATFIAEYALEVPSDELGALDFDYPDPVARVEPFKELCAARGIAPFPEKRSQQVALGARAMIARWSSPRAARARKKQNLPADLPLALHLETIVVTEHDDEGYGFAVSRDMDSGAFAPNGMFHHGFRMVGERMVDGHPLDELPGGVEMLTGVLAELEGRLRSAVTVDFEYGPEGLALVGLEQLRRPNARVATSLAVDLAIRGITDESAAVGSTNPVHVVELLHPQPKLTGDEVPLVTGLGASPGAAVGRIALDSETAVELTEAGDKAILVMSETTPGDLPGMMAATGILTVNGGSASHAAVVARGMGRPAICGAGDLRIDRDARTISAGEHVLAEGDLISIDGSSGVAYVGELRIERPVPSPSLTTLLGWADDARRLGVRANADNAADASVAFDNGAEGIGLCRTEHMFLGDRLPFVRAVILSHDVDTEEKALAELAVAQREDFRELLREVGDRPVTVRLLDAPMHEFLPSSADELEDEKQGRMLEHLHEENPMLGVRGVRLALMHEGLYPAQVEGLFNAWVDVVHEDDVRPQLEVMVPLVSIPEELVMSLRLIRRVNQQVASRTGMVVPFKIGTMVETPRAAMMAGKLAQWAEFLSFGTNDLTQLTYGFSRDDVERRMLGTYLEKGLMTASPFAELDGDGVAGLMEYAAARAREVRPDIKLGICGEHGGDPASIAICERLGLDYVSASSTRIPVARLAAAHAVTGTDS